jgi:hypothetical protein
MNATDADKPVADMYFTQNKKKEASYDRFGGRCFMGTTYAKRVRARRFVLRHSRSRILVCVIPN